MSDEQDDILERLEFEMWIEDPRGLTLTRDEIVGTNRVMEDAAAEIRRLRARVTQESEPSGYVVIETWTHPDGTTQDRPWNAPVYATREEAEAAKPVGFVTDTGRSLAYRVARVVPLPGEPETP